MVAVGYFNSNMKHLELSSLALRVLRDSLKKTRHQLLSHACWNNAEILDRLHQHHRNIPQLDKIDIGNRNNNYLSSTHYTTMGSIIGKESVAEPAFRSLMNRSDVKTTYELREYGKRFVGTYCDKWIQYPVIVRMKWFKI